MINSLGVFEHPQSLGLLHSAYNTISTFFVNAKNPSKVEDLTKALTDLKTQYEIYGKISSDKDFAWRRDTMQYAEQLQCFSIQIQLLINLLELALNISKI